MTGSIEFFVPGTPAPQGSKSFKGIRGGRGILVESSKALGPWRERVALAAHSHADGLMGGPIGIRLKFVMPRPKSTPKRTTPPAVKRNGDLDKLTRAVLDALSNVIYVDDCQVIDMRCTKRIAEIGEKPGVSIELSVGVEVKPGIIQDEADRCWKHQSASDPLI